MPLNESGSKKAFSENVATEINAGKPRDQALAISYSVQREHSPEGFNEEFARRRHERERG